MKKLMIALSAAAMAVSSQAAYVSWTCLTVQKDGTSLTSGSQYAFFFDSDTAAQTAMAEIAALNGKGATAVSTYMADANFSDTKRATAAGAFSVGTSAANGGYKMSGTPALPTEVALGLEGNTKYYMFSVIFDTETITDASKFMIASGGATTTGATTKDATTTGVASFALGAQATTGSKTWYAVGTPEPTSAMLLLLGFAGLALRRRRA